MREDSEIEILPMFLQTHIHIRCIHSSHHTHSLIDSLLSRLRLAFCGTSIFNKTVLTSTGTPSMTYWRETMSARGPKPTIRSNTVCLEWQHHLLGAVVRTLLITLPLPVSRYLLFVDHEIIFKFALEKNNA